MPDDTTAPADLCWLCEDRGGIAVHVHWSAQRGKLLWTAHAPTSVSHPVRPCPACRPAAPVAAEGLRERLIAAELAAHVELMSDGHPSVIAHSNKEAADRAIAALAGDPGDLPARMLTAARDAGFVYDRSGLIGFDWDDYLKAVIGKVMSVRWEDHAATVAKLDHALAELSALRDHRARWETEKARADKAEAELAEERKKLRFAMDAAAELDRRASETQAELETAREERDAARLVSKGRTIEHYDAIERIERVVEMAKQAKGGFGKICCCGDCEDAQGNGQDALHEPTWTAWTLNPADVLAGLAAPETPEEKTDEA